MFNIFRSNIELPELIEKIFEETIYREPAPTTTFGPKFELGKQQKLSPLYSKTFFRTMIF